MAAFGDFLVKNFDNYEHLFQFPCRVFCVVGDARREYLFQDKNALKSFLLSKNSVYMWNTDVDIPILCNIYSHRISANINMV